MNITGSFLETLDDTISSFSALTGIFSQSFPNEPDMYSRDSSSQQDNKDIVLEEEVHGVSGKVLRVSHQVSSPLQKSDRLAFSLFNLTGERIRIHRPFDMTRSNSLMAASLTYLNHLDAVQLHFPATFSAVKNLDVCEVSFEDDSATFPTHNDTRRTVDVQLPGFRWVKGISVDTTGKQFKDLCPISDFVHVSITALLLVSKFLSFRASFY